MRMTRDQLANDFHEQTHGRYRGITKCCTPTRAWEELCTLKPFLYLAWAPVLWVLDRVQPEKRSWHDECVSAVNGPAYRDAKAKAPRKEF